MSTVIIGAAGAVGKRLCAALARRGDRVIAADRSPQLPDVIKAAAAACEPNVDVTNMEALNQLFSKHRDIDTVWNLAAPLSVETAVNPEIAEAITIGGMKNVLEAMGRTGVRKICFTDSIGSFGSAAPRVNCTARWLTENPTQDPGSDYGRQKRGCRELMADFSERHGGDPRFAVLPGVLHSEALWGGGTTEYALEALQAASRGQPFPCPVSPDVTLPMIFVEDLMRGLLALQDADERALREPEHGYAIPGLSFSANDLFEEIRRHVPGFETTLELNPTMEKFARLWPDTLSLSEPRRDLGYAPSVGLAEMVEVVLSAHFERNASTANTFRQVDLDGNGTLERGEIHDYLLRIISIPSSQLEADHEELRGALRELCHELVERAMADMGHDAEGRISIEEFQHWSKANTLTGLVEEWKEKKFEKYKLWMQGAAGGASGAAGGYNM
jgi:threonine 3-dehydrogenase